MKWLKAWDWTLDTVKWKLYLRESIPIPFTLYYIITNLFGSSNTHHRHETSWDFEMEPL